AGAFRTRRRRSPLGPGVPPGGPGTGRGRDAAVQLSPLLTLRSLKERPLSTAFREVIAAMRRVRIITLTAAVVALGVLLAADRPAMMRKHDGKNYDSYGVHHDLVRRVEDSTGAGHADKSTIFAEGFKSPETGIGAGVLARGNKVWYTCIPDLWLLEDTKGTG